MNTKVKYFVIIFIAFLIIAVPVVLFLISHFASEDNRIISPLIINSDTDPSPSIIKESSELKSIYNNNFNSNDDYAVVIKNFQTGEEFLVNEDKEYDSASLYKLWVMAVLLEQIKNDELSLSDQVSADKNELDEILRLTTPTPIAEGEEIAVEEKEPVPISMSVGEAMDKMITRSDNYAALMLSKKAGYKNVEKFLEENNYKNSSFDSPPKTTAEDISIFYEKLYAGEVVNQEYSKFMLEVLGRQEFDDRIPKYLPESVNVAHKTGELLGNKHDAGIVYSDKGDYMIVVLSKTKSESIAAEKIAKFSEDVFNYFLGI